jgi:hypothetical protein
MDRLRAHARAWRAAQARDALLEADVRKILRERYDQLGETMVLLVGALEEVRTALGQDPTRTSA